MLGHLRGQITAAVREDIRLMRGHDSHPHPHNTASMKLTPGLVSCKSPHYQKKQKPEVGQFLWGWAGRMRSLDSRFRNLRVWTFIWESVAFEMAVR